MFLSAVAFMSPTAATASGIGSRWWLAVSHSLMKPQITIISAPQLAAFSTQIGTVLRRMLLLWPACTIWRRGGPGFFAGLAGARATAASKVKDVFFMLLSQSNFRYKARKQCQAERHDANKIITTFVFIQLESLNIRRPSHARLISALQQQIEMRKTSLRRRL